ncbi:SCP2 sterol-binding domain-containing protein [Ruminococcus gauvreauii]|uniref:SCP2 sterol-binding domain-containing protein n=1 Tax=Ruminococcus gauvreauii TaxID=438033 RepID=A0ABY5VCT5_9FIRM|nr:SCP2 sterol-binding domain-containing protein [Ruminococcus gauvreauii]UWP58290.1 SCP2 sterol-binding domain-containing protein [Ruminococcus gauvreauii]
MSSVKEFINKIPEYFDEEKGCESDLTIVYDIHDMGEKYTIRIKNGACTVEPEGSDDYDVKLRMTSDNYLKTVYGVASELAYWMGTIRFIGKRLAYEELQYCLNIPADSGIMNL